MNPLVIGGVVLVVVVVLVVILLGKGNKGDAVQPAAGVGGNIASKEKLEGIGSGSGGAAAASKPASSQTLDTQVKPPEKDIFRDVTPDSGLVTQYQEGTGEGIEEIEERLKEDPNNEDLLDWLAFMYYSNNKLEEAITTYEKAINLNYENEHQHYYLGNAYYKQGKFDRALEEWEVVVSLKPDSKLAQNAQERIAKVRETAS